MLFLDINCLPMWMATIRLALVSENARPKIAWYQKEAARVLAEAFLPPEIRNSQPDVTVNVDGGISKSMWTDLIQRLDSWTHWSRKVETEVATVAKEARSNSEDVAALQAKVERLEQTLRDTLQLVHEIDPARKHRGYKKPFMELWDRLCS